MSDETNVIVFKPRPPEAPAPMRLELKLHDQDCRVDFWLIDAEDNIRAVIEYRPDSCSPDELDLLRAQWAHWREDSSAVAS